MTTSYTWLTRAPSLRTVILMETKAMTKETKKVANSKKVSRAKTKMKTTKTPSKRVILKTKLKNKAMKLRQSVKTKIHRKQSCLKSRSSRFTNSLYSKTATSMSLEYSKTSISPCAPTLNGMSSTSFSNSTSTVWSASSNSSCSLTSDLVTDSARASKRSSRTCCQQGTTLGGANQTFSNLGTTLKTRNSKRSLTRVTTRLISSSNCRYAQPKWTPPTALYTKRLWMKSILCCLSGPRALDLKSETIMKISYSKMKIICTNLTHKLRCTRNAIKLLRMKRPDMINRFK